MNGNAVQTDLLRLFERHDVELELDEDWLVTDGDFPAVRTRWHEGEEGAPGRLDVDVVISEERHIEESFAGYGRGDAGARDALKAFERDVLYVLLAACWYVTDDRRIQLQSWDLGMRSWDVFVGPLTFSRDDVAAPEGLLSGLHDALRNESLSGELHWVRLFRREADDGSVVAEALLDNQPWPGGDRLLSQLKWPSTGMGYSARCFIALDIRDY
ncbi:DUF6348 family protein [Dyella caseinilytica]|uniref:Immunity protein 22 of polymorphic toxin system n=1 Tax=Dyella caseinilytica TaxID=1849581 RepID=A0ABX7GXD0_9GAMM|nr:DUF6348 family protein [Dyella caseinilytica]QRN54975.1 hypothetical protein ISN74_06425 [Dyella caseinilytica]GFZ98367.1 hypothetical protein GCM10011408_18740 [Dyella caseinilytica]